MTQNPYAQLGRQDMDPFDPVESRTSLLAIFSLVAALLCFLPGAGALAAILGGAAIIFISQSRGRLRGMGMAVTGVVLGLFFTLLWITLAIGAQSAVGVMNQQFVGPADAVMKGIDAKDHAAARGLFVKKADDSITNAQLDDFADRVRAQMGAYKSGPKGIIDVIVGYGQAGQAMQGMQGRPDVIPVPMQFEKGWALLIMQIDPSSMSGARGGANVKFPVVNVCVATLSGKHIWLVDPDKVHMGSGGSGSGDKPDPDADPKDGDVKAPKDVEPKP